MNLLANIYADIYANTLVQLLNETWHKNKVKQVLVNCGCVCVCVRSELTLND